MTTPKKLVFIDTETTDINRETRQIWDLAYIVREEGKPDREVQRMMTVDLSKANTISLNMGGFHDRHPQGNGNAKARAYDWWVSQPTILADLHDAYLVGAVPSFDEETLWRHLTGIGHSIPSWNYHLIDVETLAAGQMGLQPPWNFDRILAAYDLKYDEADRHTAIGDARMARDLYDAVMARSELHKEDSAAALKDDAHRLLWLMADRNGGILHFTKKQLETAPVECVITAWTDVDGMLTVRADL